MTWGWVQIIFPEDLSHFSMSPYTVLIYIEFLPLLQICKSREDCTKWKKPTFISSCPSSKVKFSQFHSPSLNFIQSCLEYLRHFTYAHKLQFLQGLSQVFLYLQWGFITLPLFQRSPWKCQNLVRVLSLSCLPNLLTLFRQRLWCFQFTIGENGSLAHIVSEFTYYLGTKGSSLYTQSLV